MRKVFWILILIVAATGRLEADGPTAFYFGLQVTLKDGSRQSGYAVWSDSSWCNYDLDDFRHMGMHKIPDYVFTFNKRDQVPPQECYDCSDGRPTGQVFGLWVDYLNFRVEHRFEGLEGEGAELLQLYHFDTLGPPFNGLVPYTDPSKAFHLRDIQHAEAVPGPHDGEDACIVSTCSALHDRMKLQKPDYIIDVDDKAGGSAYFIVFGGPEKLEVLVEQWLLEKIMSRDSYPTHYTVNGLPFSISEGGVFDLERRHDWSKAVAIKAAIEKAVARVAHSNPAAREKRWRIYLAQQRPDPLWECKYGNSGVFVVDRDPCYD